MHAGCRPPAHRVARLIAAMFQAAEARRPRDMVARCADMVARRADTVAARADTVAARADGRGPIVGTIDCGNVPGGGGRDMVANGRAGGDRLPGLVLRRADTSGATIVTTRGKSYRMRPPRWQRGGVRTQPSEWP